MKEKEENLASSFKEVFEANTTAKIIDVRSPAEFEKGRILGAINIPLLDDDERAIIGTLYKQESPEVAFDKGLTLVGPKMSDFVTQARAYLGNEQGLIYCWRGGKRSKSMSWLMNTSGLHTKVLPGGYKAYRQYACSVFEEKSPKFVILGGKTGSGKTIILHKLKEKGQQVIDLEGLANHKGSAFGWIGETDQPSVEHFENMLANEVRQMDFSNTIWVENESRMVGKIPIHQDFWDSIKASPLINIEIPTEARVKHLASVYNADNIEDLVLAFERIKKRLGGLNINLAMDALADKDLEKAAEIALIYYDKSYTNLLDKSTADPIYRITFDHADFDEIADYLIKYVASI